MAKPNSEESKKVRSYRMDDETYEKFHAQAESLGLDIPSYIHMLVKFDFSKAIAKNLEKISNG